MSKYENGKIYKILNNIDDEVYVGSTTQPLSKRIYQHRLASKHCPQYKLYTHMNNLGVDGFYIEFIESYSCKSKEELCAKEGEWIRKIATLNKVISGRSKQDSDKQWRENNKEYTKELHIQYRENNKERIIEAGKIRYENNKEQIKAAVKAYRENNV